MIVTFEYRYFLSWKYNLAPKYNIPQADESVRNYVQFIFLLFSPLYSKITT
jgi:hypothetical protein